MSQRKINVDFKTQDGKVHPQIVDTNKTVDRMLADFLEKQNTIERMNDYSFIVSSVPLTKDGVIKKCKIYKTYKA